MNSCFEFGTGRASFAINYTYLLCMFIIWWNFLYILNGSPCRSHCTFRPVDHIRGFHDKEVGLHQCPSDNPELQHGWSDEITYMA